MKKQLLFLVFISANVIMAQRKVDYKKVAIDNLTNTMYELETLVNQLTPEDLTYVPKDGGWTVLNCLEHLAFVEPLLGSKLRATVAENNVDKTKDLSADDWKVIVKVTDRTNKVVTPEPFRPQEEMKDKGRKYFLSQLKKDRKDIITFLENTNADLRHIFGPYPYGEVDMVQQALVIGSHMYRHTMQIKEIIIEIYPEKAETARL